jgi:NTP pyrophosphatase (non-canonical NTP hydrolase)
MVRLSLERKHLLWKRQLLQWKHDKQSIFITTAEGKKWRNTRGKEWFTAEYVEELVELLEATVGDRILGMDDNTEADLGGWLARACLICGYRQGKGFEGVKRKGNEHYVRLGRAWKRIVDM